MMKTAGAITIFGLMISLLLVPIAVSDVVAGENEVVLDLWGRPVKANVQYLVMVKTKLPRTTWMSGYGMSTSNGIPCINMVLVTNMVTAIRIPVKFISSSDVVVRISTKLNIRFALPTHCRESGFWGVPGSSFPTKEVALTLTGSESSNDSTFTIKKYDNGSYKFVFGSAENSTEIGLEDIGHGISKLVLSNNSGIAVSFVPLL